MWRRETQGLLLSSGLATKAMLILCIYQERPVVSTLPASLWLRVMHMPSSRAAPQ